MQQELKTETSSKMIADQCLPKLTAVLEKWEVLEIREDGSYGADLNDSEKRTIEKVIANVVQNQVNEGSPYM
jgi:hypothetical protein